MSKEYRTAPESTENLPAGIPYIIGNEAAERFSFYGMKGILFVFMTTYLHWMTREKGVAMPDAAATHHYHNFVFYVYITPIIGAFLADALLGKYRTILYLSVVYCLGHLCLAFIGFDFEGIKTEWWLFGGLGLIAMGSGGIKPCVSAHVGDQFGKSNRSWISKVFGWFYISINLGAAISNIATPWLLQWYGPHIAFGIPGVLMAIATFVFWLGRKKFIHVPPSGISFFKEVFSAEGLKCIGKLISIFVFFTIFWALFDQTGSRWVLQASNMNRTWLSIEWLPSQIQIANPILILILVPFLSLVVYPLVNKHLFELTPLRKIGIGLFIMVITFTIPAYAQQLIDQGQTPSIAWQLLAYVFLTTSEVMVSVTGLEFAYTQSPPKMKSVVMALYLAFVAFGNLVTAKLNEQIQIPAQTAVVQELKEDLIKDGIVLKDDKIIELLKNKKDLFDRPINFERVENKLENMLQFTLDGYDRKTGTNDDMVVTFIIEKNKQDETKFELSDMKLETATDQVLKTAMQRIEAEFMEGEKSGEQTKEVSKKLPQTAEGSELISDLKDNWNEPLQYKLIGKDEFRITSTGPDKKYMTESDVVLTGTVSRSTKDDKANKAELTWLEKRRIEVGGEEEREEIEKERGTIAETTFDSEITVGGQTTLEGAAYFWFWTKLMAVVSVLFVLVSLFYRPKEYLQEEADVLAAVET